MPLVGGLCLIVSRLQPQWASRNCPSLEDFVFV
jgi:hypothetical protein